MYKYIYICMYKRERAGGRGREEINKDHEDVIY